MSQRRKAAKGSFLLSTGEGVVYGSSFIRNMILARLLTKADFGVAAALSMVILLFELSARSGISRFIIRDRDGGEPDFLAAAHLVQFSAALLSAFAICLAAVPLAMLFGLEEHRWAILALALIPLFRGLEHMDVRRYERDLRFGPSAFVESVPQLLITIAAWPVALYLPDYRAVLVLLIAKTALSCLVSHCIAEQRYRWLYQREYILRMLRFGWPLLVAGFLMFGVLHGDQFLVATFYSMEDLGPYAAAAALSMGPTFFFAKIFNSITLPLMAKVQDDAEAFFRRYHQALSVISAFAAACVVGAILASEALMRFTYGDKYASAGTILAWLAVGNAFRNLRIAPALAAIAKGDSKNQMISNLWRIIALAPAMAIAAANQPLWIVASLGVLGEILALGASLVRLRNRDHVPLIISLVPAFWVIIAAALSFIASAIIGPKSVFLTVGIGAAASLLTAIISIFALPHLRNEVYRLRLFSGKAGSLVAGLFARQET